MADISAGLGVTPICARREFHQCGWITSLFGAKCAKRGEEEVDGAAGEEKVLAELDGIGDSLGGARD